MESDDSEYEGAKIVRDFAFLGFLGEVRGKVRRFMAAKLALPWKTEIPLGFFSVTGWLDGEEDDDLVREVGGEVAVGVEACCLDSMMAFCCCFSLRVVLT